MADPERFGRYRVVRRIGSGAFASVWLARDEELDGPVAVKVLADNWSGRVDVRERFVDEARMLRRADSDRVVRVHDIGEVDDGRPYFVMTYADSGTLADRLTGVPMDPAVALWYAVETARGVAVLHRRGIIHRDVKPSNVLLRATADGGEEVLVSDLGLAKAAAGASGLTLAAGTPGFMPPEQAEGFGLTFASDVYALAALTYRMLAGRAPRGGSGPRTVVDRADDEVAPLSGERGDLPDGLDEVLDRALRRDPDQRQPDARAFERDLVAVVGHLPGPGGLTVGGGSLRDRPADVDRLATRTAGAGVVGAGVVGAGAAGGAVAEADPPTLTMRSAVRAASLAPADAVPVEATAASPGRSGPDSGVDTGFGGGLFRPDRSEPPSPPVPVGGALPAPVAAGAPARRPRRRAARVAAALGLALVVLVAGAVIAGVVDDGLRARVFAAARGRTHVAAGSLAVDVPRSWAVQESTTAAAVPGVPRRPRVLAVGEDVAGLSEPTSPGPGVVLARWDGDVRAPLGAVVRAPGCRATSLTNGVTVGPATGSSTTAVCDGTTVETFVGLLTAAGDSLLVQVRGGSAEQRRAVLASVAVSGVEVSG